MSKRAEERASIAAYGWQSDKEGNMTLEMFPEPFRRGFVKGYEQAEKDLALTWEDIAFICQTCTEVINSLPDKPCAYTPGFKDLYGEVLTRFNEQRKK